MYFIKSFFSDRSVAGIEETPSSSHEKKKENQVRFTRRIEQFSGTDHQKENNTQRRTKTRTQLEIQEQKYETMSCKPRQSCKF